MLIATAHLIYLNVKVLHESPIVISGIPEEKNKYVILAGPPKTASTSIMSNLYAWSELASLGDWAWIHPNITCLRDISSMYCPGAYVSLYHKAWFCKSWYCLSECLFDSSYSHQVEDQCTQVKSCNTESVQKQQEQTTHPLKLVFGTENIATLLVALRINGIDPSNFIQGFVDTLPSSATKDEITFVITYRSPRIHHLRSWWKTMAYHHKNQTLRSFLSRDWNTSAMDPLYAATELATHQGFNIVVMDMSGIQAHGWDISSVVACQILGDIPCHGNHSTLILHGNVSTPMVGNVRGNKMNEMNDLTQDESLQITNAL